MKKAIAPLILIFVILLVVIGGNLAFSNLNTSPKNSPSGTYEFEIEQGEVLGTVADKLYADKVISSPYALKYQDFKTPIRTLQIGQYSLEVPATSVSVLDQIRSQSNQKQALNTNVSLIRTKKVTIREGLTLDQVIAVISDAGISNQTDLKLMANSPQAFRAKYEFLPTPLPCIYGDISKCIKYYLEGYVYPDTYSFAVDATAQDVYEQMLDNFRVRVFSNTKDQLSTDTLFQTLVLASVIERETGRTKGVTDATTNELAQERSLMASVFNNRTVQKIKWQSDPTVTYGTNLTVCQQTFKIEGCVFLDDDRVQTQYNTYKIAGVPIGPTTSPQWSVIKAVINPTPNEYLFFVSDVTGKKYFAKTESEHVANITFVTDLNKNLSKK